MGSGSDVAAVQERPLSREERRAQREERRRRAQRSGELWVRVDLDGEGGWRHPQDGAYSDNSYHRELEYRVPLQGRAGMASGFAEVDRREQPTGLALPNFQRYLALQPRDLLTSRSAACGSGKASIADHAEGLTVGDPGQPPLVPFERRIEGEVALGTAAGEAHNGDLCEVRVALDFEKQVLHLRLDGSDTFFEVHEVYTAYGQVNESDFKLKIHGNDPGQASLGHLLQLDLPFDAAGSEFEGEREIEHFSEVDGPEHQTFPLRARIRWRLRLDPEAAASA